MSIDSGPAFDLASHDERAALKVAKSYGAGFTLCRDLAGQYHVHETTPVHLCSQSVVVFQTWSKDWVRRPRLKM